MRTVYRKDQITRLKQYIKQLGEGPVLCWGHCTRWFRSFPDFLIIGAQKSGTTSLFNYLVKHPDIKPALGKEIHYFDMKYHKGARWYRAHFPMKAALDDRTLTGEATPYYLAYPLAAERIYQTMPDVKLIAILRDPVMRAYSHYQHEVTKGRERLSFEDAIAEEENRLNKEADLLEQGGGYSYNHHRFSYVSRGLYAKQLRTYLAYFSRDQLCVLSAETFFSDPVSELQKVLEVLNLPRRDLGSYSIQNQRSYAAINAETEKRLREFYRPYNQELAELLGQTFPWE